MSALQTKSVELSPNLGWPELEQLTYAFRVMLAWCQLENARRYAMSAAYQDDLEFVLIRRVTELMVVQQVEVLA